MPIKEINNRRSVRDFKSDDISEKDLIEIIKAGQFAPTARNNKATEFLVIKDQEMRNRIFDIVGQEFVKEAPLLIIPVADTNKANLPVQDLSVASQNIFLQAAAMGLGSVWKNIGDTDQEKEIKSLLKIPDNFKLINIIPIGYPKEKVVPYKDEDFDGNKIHWEKW